MIRLDLISLAAASREALMAEWREVVGRPPPKHLSKPLMMQILSHAYQLDTVGGNITGSPMWWKLMRMGTLFGMTRAISLSPTQHAP